MALLPEDPAARKAIPLYSGLFAYFPSALIEVAKRSVEGNIAHNPGQPLFWNRSVSNDHLDAELRHLVEDDKVGKAWRALADLQVWCEANGAPVAPGAKAAHPFDPVIAESEHNPAAYASAANRLTDEE